MQRDRGAAAHQSRPAGSQRGEATRYCRMQGGKLLYDTSARYFVLVQYMYKVYMGFQ
jgi:hypothetical protein